MKRRRGRRGFWWWSWLLLMTAVGGTLGGAFYGKKQWEEADKDYPSTAVVKVDIRAPFSSKKHQSAPTGLSNVNETQVMQQIESHDSLSKIAADLGLTQKWALGLEDVITSLRASVDLDLRREDKELHVTVVRADPAEASELANAIADKIPDLIKTIDASNKAEGLKRLSLELEPYVEEEENSRLALKKALEDIKVKLDPKPGIELGIYMEVPAVLNAKVEWDSARETRLKFSSEQRTFETYWKTMLKPSLVTTKATPAPTFTGPEMQPFQVQFGLYGLTLGLFGGVVLMAICWKLFP